MRSFFNLRFVGLLLGAFALSTVVLSSFGAGVALADSRADREAQARRLFAAGRYAEALDIYTGLYSETPHPTYIRNIGRCYQNMGDADKAIASFREYLRQAKDLTAEQRAQVEGYIAEMKELQRNSDGSPRAAAPAARPSGPADSGDRAPAGADATDTAAKSPPPKSAGVVEDGRDGQSPRDAGSTGASRAPAYVVAAAGLLALGVGGVFGVRAVSQRHDSDADCPMNQCTQDGVSLNNQAKTSARVADVALGVGVVGLGVATYLYFSARAGNSARGERSGSALRLVPAIGTAQAGLALGGSW